jgi:hypothetical protein
LTITGSATDQEAAAIAAAISRFRAEHTPMLAPAEPMMSAWQRTALLEGVERDPGPVRH